MIYQNQDGIILKELSKINKKVTSWAIMLKNISPTCLCMFLMRHIYITSPVSQHMVTVKPKF